MHTCMHVYVCSGYWWCAYISLCIIPYRILMQCVSVRHYSLPFGNSDDIWHTFCQQEHSGRERLVQHHFPSPGKFSIKCHFCLQCWALCLFIERELTWWKWLVLWEEVSESRMSAKLSGRDMDRCEICTGGDQWAKAEVWGRRAFENQEETRGQVFFRTSLPRSL